MEHLELNHQWDKFPWYDIYILPVVDAYLIYSPLRRVTALVNAQAVSSLKPALRNKQKVDEMSDALRGLFQEFSQPVQPLPPERTGAVQPMFLGLLPTRACNLSCVYCDFGASADPGTTMSFQMAAAAVDWMAEHVKSLGGETLDVHFFGGEPFFVPDVVEVAVHRARAVADRLGLAPRFEVATNGVFDEKQARFAGDYFDTVVLSFDGMQEIHDYNRPGRKGHGSFEIVKRTAHLLSRAPAQLCLRICITQRSVAHLEQTVPWFCETFQPAMIDFEVLQPTSESEAAELALPDPYDFAVAYVQASRVAEKHGITPVYAAALTEIPRHTFCPVGRDALIVSPDGRVSGCYLPQQAWKDRGLDLDVGWLSADGTMQLDDEAITRLRQMIIKKPRCEHCFCQWTCAGGCHVNHSYPGCSLVYDDFCIQTRLITACSLLQDLGFDQRVNGLLEDRAALQTLALQKSDRLCEQNFKTLNQL
jgi:uncharacterized protein